MYSELSILAERKYLLITIYGDAYEGVDIRHQRQVHEELQQLTRR